MLYYKQVKSKNWIKFDIHSHHIRICNKTKCFIMRIHCNKNSKYLILHSSVCMYKCPFSSHAFTKPTQFGCDGRVSCLSTSSSFLSLFSKNNNYEQPIEKNKTNYCKVYWHQVKERKMYKFISIFLHLNKRQFMASVHFSCWPHWNATGGSLGPVYTSQRTKTPQAWLH